MQPQEDPASVLLGLHGDCTIGFLLKNLYCLEYMISVLQLFSIRRLNLSAKCLMAGVIGQTQSGFVLALFGQSTFSEPMLRSRLEGISPAPSFNGLGCDNRDETGMMKTTGGGLGMLYNSWPNIMILKNRVYRITFPRKDKHLLACVLCKHLHLAMSLED